MPEKSVEFLFKKVIDIVMVSYELCLSNRRDKAREPTLIIQIGHSTER